MLSSVRRFASRLGRKIYCWGRLDSRNDPSVNGEYDLLAQVMALARHPIVLLDVGANRGEWTRKAVSLAQARNVGLTVHAFEPLSGTRALLAQAVGSLPQVKVEAVALSNAVGTASFYFQRSGAGTSSLHPVSGSQVEAVPMTTLDAWIAERQCGPIGMMKVDVEGFDALVLEGAAGVLSQGLVDVVQFEYNWRWLLNSRSLHWVFEFLRDKPYDLGKIVPGGVLTFERWHFELDRFFEGNYVLLRRGSPAASLGRAARFDESNVLCVG